VSRNQFPLSLLFVSMTPDRAGTLPVGTTALDVNFDYSNIISGQETDNAFLILDLEYLRTDVSLRRGFSKGVELGISIPFLAYYGGFLDGFISGFHNALGLPNFLRSQTPNNEIRFEYQRADGATPFVGNDSFSAVGDLSLHFKKTLLRRGRKTLAFRSILKLPTGDPETLSGSGATDLGIGAAFDRVSGRWGVYLNANYHFLGQPERFRAKDFFSFMAAVDWRFKPRLAAVLQVDHSRPFIGGELPIFRDSGQQVALGLRWRYSDRFVYEWRFVEDLSDISPDFTFAFSLGIRFPAKRD